MIGQHLHNALPFTAASIIVPRRPVKVDTVNRQVILAASVNGNLVQGFTGAATAPQGEAVTVYGDDSVVEAVAGASLGAGGFVGVSSTNGAIGPVAAASGIERYAVGQALESAAAGEIFSLYVKPRQLSTVA